MFQNTDLSANLFSFGDLRIFIDAQMDQSHIDMVKKLVPSYIPRVSFPMNRTVVHISSGTYIQMNIQVNLCEIVLPPNQSHFKNSLFQQCVNFMLRSLKIFTTTMVNEMRFKIIFYAPVSSCAAELKWWTETGITQMSWNRHSDPQNQTVLSINLPTPHIRYTLSVWIDSNYKLIKNPQSFEVSNNSVIPNTQTTGGFTLSNSVWDQPNNTSTSQISGFNFGTGQSNWQNFGQNEQSSQSRSDVNVSAGFGDWNSAMYKPTNQGSNAQVPVFGQVGGFGGNFNSKW